MLKELSSRQSDVRELLMHVRGTEDKSVEEGLAGNLGYPDEVVIATVLAVKEMALEPDSEVTPNDLIWAGAFLDHLDTQGFAVHVKNHDADVYVGFGSLAEPLKLMKGGKRGRTKKRR